MARLSEVMALQDIKGAVAQRRRVEYAAVTLMALAMLGITAVFAYFGWGHYEVLGPVLPGVSDVPEGFPIDPSLLIRLVAAGTITAVGMGVAALWAKWIFEPLARRLEYVLVEGDDGFAVFSHEGGINVMEYRRLYTRARMRWGTIVEANDEAKRIGAAAVVRRLTR